MKNPLPFYKCLQNISFKFVIDNTEDLVEMHKVIKKYDISKEKVILMPQGTTKESILEKSYWMDKSMQRKMALFFLLFTGIVMGQPSRKMMIMYFGSKKK